MTYNLYQNLRENSIYNFVCHNTRNICTKYMLKYIKIHIKKYGI